MSAIEGANKQLLDVVKPEMIRAANIAGVSINQDIMAYASFGDKIIVNSIISGLENTPPDFEGGFKALFVYTSEVPQYNIPAGFYILNISTNKAQFLDNEGNVVAQVPAVMSNEGEVNAKWSAGTRGGPGYFCVYADVSVWGRTFRAEICVS